MYFGKHVPCPQTRQKLYGCRQGWPTETQSCGFAPTPFRPCSRAAQAESRASSVRARAVSFVCMSPLRAGCPSDVPTSGTGRARLGGWRGEAVSPRRPARCLRTGGEPQTTEGGGSGPPEREPPSRAQGAATQGPAPPGRAWPSHGCGWLRGIRWDAVGFNCAAFKLLLCFPLRVLSLYYFCFAGLKDTLY